ncbi:16S rRNA (cytosine(1402)-N(4))-methyltransferase RsmH [Actinotignum urinale]|uniref:16S rRNA (cytosine(1402)-N(4))-methyltransferase RsmH n=1 Tax=Actinotignum urinale TaxID=190146 RepID=UPI0003B5162E|nr:16S rRNA (cytosine(1402)-N(4))-methyltransferase RsmH [Actinotignum urinale]MDY5160795.1 16S rRNA (cytosine(1402)-N(4))-methyltransferase RsmH [Actinotignum urinale]
MHTHVAAGNALHVPVLAQACLNFLSRGITGQTAPKNPIMIDCTLGMGGHTEAALLAFPNLTVIGIDRDPQAIALATERLAPFGSRFISVHATYDEVANVAQHYGHKDSEGGVDAILLDAGVSSLQLDESERGFSYAHDAPLDMRMNVQDGANAAELLANLDVKELTKILRDYGEEKFARNIAREIVRGRTTQPITRTGQLVDLIRDVIPAPARRTGGNPAKRAFQALRIAVNDELGCLERAIPAALDSLRVGGCIVVESYQSLEDKIVKRNFVAASTSSAPRGLPVELEEFAPEFKLLTRGAYKASEEEIAENPRSASVRLRATQRIRAKRGGGAQGVGAGAHTLKHGGGRATGAQSTGGRATGAQPPQQSSQQSPQQHTSSRENTSFAHEQKGRRS